jgi:hypothetical protein
VTRDTDPDRLLKIALESSQIDVEQLECDLPEELTREIRRIYDN